MFARVPAPAGRAAAAALELLGLLDLLDRRALRVVLELLLLDLVDVEVGGHLDLRLALADRAQQQRVDRGLDLVGVAALGGGLRRERHALRAGLAARRPHHPAGAVGDRHVLGLEPLDGGGDEVGDALDRGRLEVGRAAAEQHRRRGRLGLVGEQLVLGQRQPHVGAGDALDLADRVRELALERALVGRALLEVAGAELLVLEQLVARLLARAAEAASRRARPAPGPAWTSRR